MNAVSVAEKLKITKYVIDQNSIISIKPLVDLDLPFSYQFQEYLADFVRKMNPEEELFVDLSEVDYIASAGVGALSSTLASTIKLNKRFYICNLKPKVRAVFDVLGLMQFFTEKVPDVPAV